jgi:flagellar motor switch protein FliN/FliY
MSILEQNDIDALLASAGDMGYGPDAESSSGPKRSGAAVQVDPRELRRILHMRLPVVVTLAERKLPFKELLEITPGSIIEFDRASDADPDLSVGRKKIGRGQAVKVGEFFGLRITDVNPIEDRIRALAGK